MVNKNIGELTARTAQASDPIPTLVGGADYRLRADDVAKLDRETSRALRTGNVYYVNDFYPAEVTTYADGTSQPLSGYFGTVGAAEAAFPHFNTARHGNLVLTDQVDWVAWQSCMDYIYDNDPNLGLSSGAFGTGKVIGCGRYQINKPIVCSLASLWIDGGARTTIFYGGGCSFTWRGPEGTDTAQRAIIDFQPMMEDDTTSPLFTYPAYPYSGSPLKVTNIYFHGRQITGQTVTQGDPPDTSGVGYVSAIRSRNSRFLDIQDCTFAGKLYDAIQIVSALWCRVSFCDFGDIYRDAISVQDNDGDFSTTVWIDDNEFGLVGRYPILLNFNSANEPCPIVRRNSIENINPSNYYHTHLEEWVQGVRSSICQIGGSYGAYYNNRCEATVNQAENMWGDLHLLSCQNTAVRDNRMSNIVLTCYANTAAKTTAYNTFLTTYGYADINAERNFYTGKTGDVLSSQAHTNHIFDGMIAECIVIPDGVGISSSDLGTFANGTVHAVIPSVFTGTYITQVSPPGSADTTIYNNGVGILGSCQFVNFTDNTTTYGPLRYGSFNSRDATGDFAVITPNSTWAANTAYYAEFMPTSALAIQVGYGSFQKKWVAPTTHNGCLYECTVSGTSHATTEPTWPTTLGATVTDGTVTWKCVRSFVPYYEASWRAQSMMNGNIHVKRTAVPTAGKHFQGTVVWARVPDYSGGVPAGWVCVATGTPGTFVPIGGNLGYVAVGSLPAASNALRGCIALVSDSNQTFADIGNTVTAGGSAKLPVYCDGASWKIG